METSVLARAVARLERGLHVADAVPAPRVSLPVASIEIVLVRLVLVGELGGALVGQRERAELDLHLALDLIAVDRDETLAPGMHGAIRSTSSRTSQACSGGTGTVNELSSSMAMRTLLSRRFCL